MAYYYPRSQISDDYCAYLTKLERKTSMREGPHFPRGMFKDNVSQDGKPEAGKENMSTATVEQFGRAAHIKHESRRGSTEEDVQVDIREYVKHDVEMDAREYVKHKHPFGPSRLFALMLHKRRNK